MTGWAILDKYQKLRDFSGSKDDKYAQLLDTILGHLHAKNFFPLLEKAEKEGKRLDLDNPYADWITIDNVILV